MLNRMTRAEAAKYIGCSVGKLAQMERAGLLSGVYYETGEVKPTIHAVLPIEEAEKAHEILYQGKNVGKVVLTVEE